MTRQNDFDKLHSITYYSLSGPDALSMLRVVGPATSAGLKVVYGVDNGIINVGAVKEGDIVVLQRDICKHHDSYEAIISLAHSQKKPVIFDLDDLLFELPDDHPDRLTGYYTEALLPVLQAVIEVDLVTVATEPLRDYLLPFNEKIEVIPNYLNDTLWSFRNFEKPPAQDDVITIGYMGGHSHKPDLLLVLPALRIIKEKYPHRIRYHFWGIEPPEELIEISQIDWCPPKSYEYRDFVNFFQTQRADIAIAPLCDNPFNSSKSAIKYFEYSANGFPGVYSNVNPYSAIIANGEDGFLASSINDWVEMLTTLIDNQGLRFKFVVNAQQKIRQNWLLSDNYRQQLDIYRDLLHSGRVLQNDHLPYLKILQQLSNLYSEEFKRNKSQTKHLLDNLKECEGQKQTLSNQLEEKLAAIQNLLTQNAELNNEIMSYVLSKSWRYTRPFRRMNSKIGKVFK
mgnify:CR=1 FL=1